MSIGEHLNTAATRMALAAFTCSLRLFELQPGSRLAALRRRVLTAGAGPETAVPVPGPARTSAARRTAATSGNVGSGVPIVFIHRGDSPHLAYSLAQARKSNPRSVVFLLGDSSNDRYEGVEHHDGLAYSNTAAEFAEIYRHYSTHPHGFELVCFQRWFMLRDFMRAHDLDHCVYLDSDVLLYADVTDEMRKFMRFEFTLCWHSIGCVFFLNDVRGLDRFCRFVTDVYAKVDRYAYDRIVAHYATRRRHGLGGGACDMTALQLYHESNFGRIGEASHIIDGSVYDPNINEPNPGFEMDGSIKKIVWQNGEPYGTFVKTGETIKFNSLHFNGAAKSLMPQYCSAPLDSVEPALVHD